MPRLSKIGAAALAAFGWTGLQSVTASVLVVAGGAGGGRGNNVTSYAGGGGGAGGFRTGTLSLNPTQSYTITVGAGGAGSTSTSNKGTNGTDSVFSSITSTGGGGGGSLGSGAGANGGSGGGAGSPSAAASGGTGNTPATSPSQGNNGGSTSGFVNYGGGGGGATAAGGTGNTVSGAGGAGTASSITGSSVTYAGGGGGGGFDSGGAGGSGGGGTGGISSSVGTAGTANTGGGGGGGPNNNGSSGGSGIVIISYVGAQQFGGGVVTSVGGNTIHTFTTSGTLVPITPLSANYLVVAGGGGGGGRIAGGGGAGGLLSGSGITIDPNSTYLVTVGSGGSGGTNTGGSGTRGVSGSNSSFLAITSTGGGGGGNYGSNDAGLTGGSGGGGSGLTGTGGSGTSGQGNSGGTGSISGNISEGGGGGGASAAGSNGDATGSGRGNGGAGTASSISGSSVTYAGGGGGGAYFTAAVAGDGGAGGGGAGSIDAGATGGTGTTTPAAGTANTGGGGGGNGVNASGNGGNGGSGIVIISYAGATQLMAGGTVTISGGNVIHTFTSTGFLAPIDFVGNSLRFRSSASAYLNRTPPTTGSTTAWTWSAWVKRGYLGANQTTLFFGDSTSSNYGGVHFTGDNLYLDNRPTGGLNARLTTTQVFRDPAAWYHVVAVWNTANATSTDRLQLYVNGTRITAFSTATYPAQNTTSVVNTNIAHEIGCTNAASSGVNNFFDGYLTEVNFIDGQALTPSSFGTFNSYGVWQPITYGGSYGTNGFYLPFTNATSTTTLGFDFSPNGNNWTTNNISLTAGATYDSMTDVPTLTSATAANYCVMNPLDKGTNSVAASGNLDISSNNGNRAGIKGSFGVSTGKWYFEYTKTTLASASVGVASAATGFTSDSNVGDSATSWGYLTTGNKLNNNTSTAYGATWTSNDVIGVALDMDAGTITFYKNNSSQGQAFSGLAGTVFPMGYNGSATADIFNFGQRPFAYTPPSGFVALNTFNL